MTLRRNIQMVAGDAKTLRVTVGDGSRALDLSGLLAAALHIRVKSGALLLVQKTLGNGVQVVDPVSGRLDVQLDAADTAALSGNYEYQLSLTLADGRPATVLIGQIAITPRL